jgi:hypothetical protein
LRLVVRILLRDTAGCALLLVRCRPRVGQRRGKGFGRLLQAAARCLLYLGACASPPNCPARTSRAPALGTSPQSRLKRTHEGIVTADGWIEIPDGRAFPQPSPALKAQTGIDINGWGQYTPVPSGRRLQDLHAEVAKHQA